MKTAKRGAVGVNWILGRYTTGLVLLVAVVLSMAAVRDLSTASESKR